MSEDSAPLEGDGVYVDQSSDTMRLARSLTVPILPKGRILSRSVDEAIAWARGQVDDPTQDWTALCQSFCRQSYGVPAWSSSAIGAWGKIPPAKRHIAGKPSEAPRGALLYYGGGKWGHVAIAVGKRTKRSCLSNDYVSRGRIDQAPRTFPRWGLIYLGWSFWTPYGEMAPWRP